MLGRNVSSKLIKIFMESSKTTTNEKKFGSSYSNVYLTNIHLTNIYLTKREKNKVLRMKLNKPFYFCD